MNRLRQVTSAIKQDGANQVSIITSTAERQAAIEFAKAAAMRPSIVGEALKKSPRSPTSPRSSSTSSKPSASSPAAPASPSSPASATPACWRIYWSRISRQGRHKMSDRAFAHSAISIGFVDDFKGSPTLLCLGESEGLIWFAELIKSGWTGNFSTLEGNVHLAGFQLELRHSVAARLEREGNQLRWSLSDSCRDAFPEQLQVLARSDRPGHAYLDPPSGSGAIQVVASKGEYFPSHVLENNSGAERSK